ncbi:unnamed protein product [Brassica napus]|uniref:(rape) hypothetical protein n=1 Tax=Brassica napus TaxID=3708 RepID=A0A816T909_BRANA|nr:unnamed protein product [Brassica napus]
MRKHGWQLPYHPLQVVAVAVFLALGFAFYVFFAPFVGNKIHQYIAMSIYTPLFHWFHSLTCLVRYRSGPMKRLGASLIYKKNGEYALDTS